MKGCQLIHFSGFPRRITSWSRELQERGRILSIHFRRNSGLVAWNWTRIQNHLVRKRTLLQTIFSWFRGKNDFHPREKFISKIIQFFIATFTGGFSLSHWIPLVAVAGQKQSPGDFLWKTIQKIFKPPFLGSYFY